MTLFARRARTPEPLAASPSFVPRHGAGDELVGYRLLRVLGTGNRATAFLGHPLRSGEDSAPSSTVLKVFHPGTSADSAHNELTALSYADDAHVVRLRDVGSDQSGLPVLVLERLHNGTLAQLLARRGSLEAGEAVTLLAPLGDALARLHARGICHGRLSARSVMFRASGAPVLMGFGEARLLRNPSEVGAAVWREALADDTAAYLNLVDGVLGATTSPGHSVRELREWVAECDPREQAPGFTAVVAERIFGIAPARPVRFGSSGLGVENSVPLRLTSPGAETVSAGPGDGALAENRALWHRGMHLPSWLGSSIEEMLESTPFRSLGARAKKNLGRVRRPVWIVGGATALAVLLVGAMLPQPDANDAGAAPAGHNASASPSPVATARETAVEGDDPVAAAEALLEARERCFAELSVLCLDSVFQQGSAALTEARRTLGAIQDGAEADPEVEILATAMTVIERLGDTALLGLGNAPETQPASLLLMKGEAGWRIREILDD